MEPLNLFVILTGIYPSVPHGGNYYVTYPRYPQGDFRHDDENSITFGAHSWNDFHDLPTKAGGYLIIDVVVTGKNGYRASDEVPSVRIATPVELEFHKKQAWKNFGIDIDQDPNVYVEVEEEC